MDLWVIVAGFALLMVLGSIVWIMPSKRDRRIARLRQAAILKGVRVKLMDFPVINMSGRVEEASVSGAAYSLCDFDFSGVHAGWMLIRNLGEAEESPEGWGWYINQSSLPEPVISHISHLLEKYQDQLLAVSILSGSVSLGWNEQGAEEDLDEFKLWGTKLLELIAPFLASQED